MLRRLTSFVILFCLTLAGEPVFAGKPRKTIREEATARVLAESPLVILPDEILSYITSFLIEMPHDLDFLWRLPLLPAHVKMQPHKLVIWQSLSLNDVLRGVQNGDIQMSTLELLNLEIDSFEDEQLIWELLPRLQQLRELHLSWWLYGYNDVDVVAIAQAVAQLPDCTLHYTIDSCE